MYEQRAATSRSERASSGQLWLPEGLPEGLEVDASDAYVVVDDLMDGVAVLAYSSWPRLDRVGRLSFADEDLGSESTFHIDAEDLQSTLNEKREAAVAVGMDPALTDRPVRIGDAFLIRNLAAGDPRAWELVVDVTPQARTAAKTALYGAVAPRVSEEEAVAFDLMVDPADEEPPEPSGPSGATPAV